MSLSYLILIFAYLILITSKTKIKRNLANDDNNFINSGEKKEFCDIQKDSGYYEFIGVLKNNYNKIYIEISILKEMCDEDIEDFSFYYCGLEDLSVESAWNCLFFGITDIFLKRTENEKYYIFNTSFSLKKEDYNYLDFLIEVPDDFFLECVTMYFKGESDDGSNAIIYIIIFVLLFIVIALILIFYVRRLRRIKEEKGIEKIQKESLNYDRKSKD